MSKTVDYLAMAQNAADKADASALDNVRDLHERSAAVWRDLARSEQSREKRRADIISATARRLEAMGRTAVGGVDGL